MNASPYADPDESWEDYGPAASGELPGRPRRRFLNPLSALLLAVVLGAVGFYVGVRIEKGQLSGSSTGGASAAFSRLLSSSGTSGARGTGSSGTAGRFGNFGGPGGATVGTVASVNGRTIYVTEAGGNTVKVKLSSATKITKDETVGRNQVDPGDTVVISGVSGSGGTLSATSLTDSGARSSGTTSSSSASSSSSSPVSSLFGGR
jgi:hypothetical protein